MYEQEMADKTGNLFPSRPTRRRDYLPTLDASIVPILFGSVAANSGWRFIRESKLGTTTLAGRVILPEGLLKQSTRPKVMNRQSPWSVVHGRITSWFTYAMSLWLCAGLAGVERKASMRRKKRVTGRRKLHA